MKKIFSCFLASLICVFGGLNVVLAGGKDGKEVLPDGTIIYFISTENMKSFREKYEKRHQELIDSRWTTAQNLSVKGFAVGVASLAYHFVSKINNPTLNVLGKTLSVVGGLVSFFYPDVRDKLLGKEYGGTYIDEKNGKLVRWGKYIDDKWYCCHSEKVDSVHSIVSALKALDIEDELRDTDKGYMLVFRSKHGITPLSDLYEQDDRIYHDLLKSSVEGY